LPDAALLDTSSMDVEEAVAFVLGLARERGLSAG
jgi:cytidylate kinase